MNHALLGELSLSLNNLNLQELKKYSKGKKIHCNKKYRTKNNSINYKVEKKIKISNKPKALTNIQKQ